MPSPPPWPVLHKLNERYQVGALPADDESGLVLYPAEGLLRSEKEAALRYAKDNLENLLHDLALEHLPRHVWLAGEKHSNAIQNGQIDGRTRQAQAIIKTREALAKAPDEAIKALTRHSIAVAALIQNEIMAAVQQNGTVLEKDGRLSKLIGDDLLKVQRSMLQAAGLLAQLEGLAPGRMAQRNSELSTKGKEKMAEAKAVAAIIMDIADEGGVNANPD